MIVRAGDVVDTQRLPTPWNGFSSKLETIDWSSPVAVDEARTSMSNCFAHAASLWAMRCRRRWLSVSTTVRNVVRLGVLQPETPLGERYHRDDRISALALTVQALERRAEDPGEAELLEEIRLTYLEEYVIPMHELARVLWQGARRPKRAELEAIRHRIPRAFPAVVLAHSYEDGSRQGSRLCGRLAQIPAEAWGSSIVRLRRLRGDDEIAQLVGAWRSLRLQRMRRKDFQKIPEWVRESLARSSPQTRAAMLASPLRRAIERGRLLHLHARVDHESSAAKLLRQGLPLGAGSLGIVCTQWPMAWLERTLSRTLAEDRPKDSGYVSSPPPPTPRNDEPSERNAIRRVIRAGFPALVLLCGSSAEQRRAVWQAPPRTLSASFSGLSRQQQLQALDRLTERELGQLIDRVGAGDALQEVFSGYLVSLANRSRGIASPRFAHCVRVLGWSSVIEQLSKHNRARSHMRALFGDSSRRRRLVRELSQEALEQALSAMTTKLRAEVIGTLAKKRARGMLDGLAAVLVGEDDLSGLRLLGERVGDTRMQRALDRLVDDPAALDQPKVRRALLAGALPLSFDRRVHHEASELCSALSREDCRSARRVLRRCASQIDALLEYVSGAVRTDGLERSLLHAVGGLTDAVVRATLAREEIRQALERMVREEAPAKLAKPVMDALAARTDWLPLAAALAPKRYAQQALEHAPARDLVPMIVRSFSLRRHLDARAPRTRLRDLIPAARAQGSNGYDAAALEVAFAFSLSDLDFIRGLAGRVARQAADEGTQLLRGFMFDELYRTYELPKRCGGKRRITVPSDALKRLQRRLVDRGFREVALPGSAHGFRPRRSIVTNAEAHTGQRVVMNVDIDDFFSSTRYDRIVGACRKLCGGKLTRAAALLVADVCSFRGALPTGAPTSPDIGNIVLAGIDRALDKVCLRRGFAYTRYADDLTFSGSGGLTKLLPFVEALLAEKGYRLDPKKLNIFRRGRRQVVTGLVVNERANLKRTDRRRLRAAVHHRCQGRTPTWHGKPIGDPELRGRLGMLRMCDQRAAEALIAQLDRATGKGEAVQ
jgi:retron-type reverse transcriptase